MCMSLFFSYHIVICNYINMYIYMYHAFWLGVFVYMYVPFPFSLESVLAQVCALDNLDCATCCMKHACKTNHRKLQTPWCEPLLLFAMCPAERMLQYSGMLHRLTYPCHLTVQFVFPIPCIPILAHRCMSYGHFSLK